MLILSLLGFLLIAEAVNQTIGGDENGDIERGI